MAKNLNLVFQGGGVRGIAYAGLLQQLPVDIRIRGVGGTSVGALMAAFVATGASAQELTAIVRDPTLKALLLDAEVQRLDRLRHLWAACRPLIASLARRKVPLFASGRTLWKHRNVLADLLTVWNEKGLFGLERLRQWLYGRLGTVKFGDPSLKVRNLRIVAADISRQEYVVFDQGHAGTEIVEAICASVAIPIFFRPEVSGSRHFVDGGLLSNFPTFLFADSEWPTVGFRLRDVVPPGNVDDSFDYLKGLLLTATDAHDKVRSKSPRFTEVDISVPNAISSFGFAGLTDQQVTELFEAGRSTTVDWASAAAEVPIDPLPGRASEVLSLALEGGSRLLERSTDASMFVDSLDQTVEMTVTIDPDWSAHYDKVSTLTARGRGAVVVIPLTFQGRADLGGISLLDLQAGFEEVGSATQPILLPAVIRGDERGFAAVLVPPLGEGQSARRFRSWFRVAREFEASLGEGRQDAVRCITVQLATRHVVALTLRVRLDTRLGDVEVTQGFQGSAKTSILSDGERTLRQYEFVAEAGLVNTRTVHTVSLRRR